MGHISDRSDKFVQKIFGPKRPPAPDAASQPPPKVSKNQEMLKRLNRRKQELLDDRRKV